MTNETTNANPATPEPAADWNRRQIRRVNFTYAIDGGMWVERNDGSKEWMPWAQLDREVGPDERDRLYRIAYAGGMTGMWYNARTGKNSYVNGEVADEND